MGCASSREDKVDRGRKDRGHKHGKQARRAHRDVPARTAAENSHRRLNHVPTGYRNDVSKTVGFHSNRFFTSYDFQRLTIE